MKLRTSLCNPTVLKKDITRFAPAWALYTVLLFMILSAIYAVDTAEYYRAEDMALSLGALAAINLCYAMLNAQLLFGDLFNTRHCNALHAMPLRRECWFATHTIAGLLFALVPHALVSLVALPMLGSGWQVALWWLLAVNLQYVFFFGLAVCSALCVGQRFAMALVYGIANFFALLVYWFYSTIYEPLLTGVLVSERVFTQYCPVWVMADSEELIRVEKVGESYQTCWVRSVTPGEGWMDLVILAAVGVALLGVALALYRRRHLESAGDFMAAKPLEPVFLVLYTMCVAAFCQGFAKLFELNEYAFLALGLAIGFFTGRMLLMRTTRVFQPKAFLGFVILCVVFVISMAVTALDPLGITTRMPAADEVEQVRISAYSNPTYADEPYLTDRSDVELALKMHQMVLEDTTVPSYEDGVTCLSFRYVLQDGSTLTRSYEVSCKSPAGKLFGQLLSRPDFVLGSDDAAHLAKNIDYFYLNFEPSNIHSSVTDFSDTALMQGLMEAILADCAEGTMAQEWSYHNDYDEPSVGWLEFGFLDSDGIRRYRSLAVWENCRHTLAYLTEHTFPLEVEVYG